MTLFFYILRQLAFGVVLAVCGMFFIAIPGVAVTALHRLGGGGLGLLVGYMPLVLLDLVPYLLPIGFLLAVTSTYGRLAADSEWTAIRMSGASPWRSFAPALAVAVVCSASLVYLQHYVSPELSYKKREYLKDAVVEGFKELSPGQTELSIGQFYLNAPFRDGNTFHEALIHVPAGDERADRTILADTVQISVAGMKVTIRMTNARTVYGTQDTTVGAPTFVLDVDELLQTDRKVKSSWRFLPTPELRAAIARGEIPEKDIAYAHYEVQARWALALTPLLYLLLGLPTGLLMKSSTQLGSLAVAVAFALVYYILSMRISKSLAQEGAVHVYLAAWTVPVVGALIGAWLCRKAYRQ
ncbi:MAG: LptF/LptG family permease [Planctomycetes bacterium]|nr:LptF/LptG family permease [Planctomycetota bacterium]